MKMFHTIRELISYCEHCKMCGDIRQLEVEVGPDLFYGIESFNYHDNILTLKLSYDPNFDSAFTVHEIPFSVDVDCNDNSFIVRNDGQMYDEFFISFHAVCPTCDSFLNSTDIDKKSDSQSFFNIGVDTENYFFDNTEPKFSITYYHSDSRKFHYESQLYVSKLSHINDMGIWEGSDHIEIPLIDINFSDEKATVEMLNMFMTFS